MGSVWRFLRRRRRSDEDFAAEIAAHLALETDRLVAEGREPEAAAWEARRRFGNVGLAREAFHRRRSVAWIESVPRQLRWGVRRLLRAPVFTSAAALTLGLGIGATTAVFSLVDGVLLRPLPFARPAELVDLSHTLVIRGVSAVNQSDATYLTYRRENRTFTDVGAWRSESVNLGDAAVGERPRAVRIVAVRASASVFRLLGVPPLEGRVFRDDEDLPGVAPVVVLGERLWRSHYAADPRMLGRSVEIDGVAHQVVGVMPARFAFPDDGTALWLPVEIDPARTRSAAFDFHGIARLRPGVTLAAADADLRSLLPRVPEAFPGRLTAAAIRLTHMQPWVQGLRDAIVGRVGRALWIVFGAGAFLLLIACLNVANLFLVRAEERQHELVVRRALGAGRGVIVTEFLAEGVLVAALGGVLGLALAVAGLGALRSLSSGIAIPRLSDVGLNAVVLAVAVGTTVLAALAMSVLPALHTSRRHVAEVLGQSGRRATAGRGRHRVRRALVVIQIALALVVVTGAGLMARSFRVLRSVPLGFDATEGGAWAFRVELPVARYPTTDAVVGLVTRALDTLAALPGVQAAGVITKLPLDEEARQDTAVFVGPLAMGQMPEVHQVAYTTPGAFAALGIPVQEGRTFAGPDPARAPLEVVVTRALARRYWGDGPAVGQRLRLAADGPAFTVVGVTGDVRGTRPDAPPDETVFVPLVAAPGPAAATGGESAMRWAPRQLAFVVRASRGGPGIVAAVERKFGALAPALAVYGVRSLADVVARSTARTTFTLELLEITAFAALLIGAVGLYGVVSYMAGLRARELAVRTALGAEPRALRRLVLTQAAAVTGLGIGLGLAAALVATRALSALLFDVAPTDPPTLLGAALLMAGVALAASWWPAHRAAAADPARALQADV